MKTAMYAFSGDPITYGHMNVVERIVDVFDRVIVGIGVNAAKQYTFSLQERENMAKQALSCFENVSVIPFRGMLIDFAYEQNVDVIVKGVRNATDLDYEQMLHHIGRSQKLGIDTHVLFTDPSLSHVSSSAVKAIQKEQGLVLDYVPLHVKQKLEETISKQYVLGVTGAIGCGKSYVGAAFKKLGDDYGVKVHNIEMDDIGHHILGNLSLPRYESVRECIGEHFGRHIINKDGSVNRHELGSIVFNDSSALNSLNNIMKEPLLVRLRREMYDKKGLILLNAALLAESNLLSMCNNHVVLVLANEHVQRNRLLRRGLSDTQIDTRLRSQYTTHEKKSGIESMIIKSCYGRMFELDNSKEDLLAITSVFSDVLTYYGIYK